MPTQNLPTRYVNQFHTNVRQTQVPFADFLDGLNQGGACSPGIGINTSDFDPKIQDWPRIEGGARGGLIGIEPFIIADEFIDAIFETDPGLPNGNHAVFIQAVAPVAPGGVLGQEAVSGLDIINRSELTVPADSWIWGVVDPETITASGQIIISEGTKLDPAVIQLIGDYSSGAVTVDMGGSTNLGVWAFGSPILITGPGPLEAAAQVAAELNTITGIIATANNITVVIQPDETTTPDAATLVIVSTLDVAP